MKTNFIKPIFYIALFSLILSTFRIDAQTTESQDKMDWWKDAKFGMFLHWGLYSKAAGYWNGQKAKGFEFLMIYEKLSLKEYAKIADDFNPVNFDAEKWVLTAKEAGMKYLIITAKHHEGFAMYDSPSSDYNIKKRTPFGKDPMKELVAACRKHNLKFGFYYSLGRDWEDPDTPTNWPTKGGRSNLVDYPNEDAKVFHNYFERKVKPQIKELLTQYGQIDVIWFDTPEGISREESKELRSLVNSIQPNCIINSRIGNGLGDYKVTEQQIVQGIENKPWEACITMSEHWGYTKDDTLYKSPELMVRQLLDIVSKGGNLLLNNGPTPEGEITIQARERLAKIGEWMHQNSEGIYGSRPWIISGESLSDNLNPENSPKLAENNTMKDVDNDVTSKAITPEVRFTTKDKNLYAYVCSFPGKQVVIKSLSLEKYGKVAKVSMLGTSKKVKWVQTDEGLTIKMPRYTAKRIPVSGFKLISEKID